MILTLSLLYPPKNSQFVGGQFRKPEEITENRGEEILAERSLLKTNVEQPTRGKFLDGRYKIIQVLHTGAFGQTYSAEDIWLIGTPQCVIKHLKPKGKAPEHWRLSRQRFNGEVETLKRVGSHPQIPQLLKSFEDEQGFYLVQELVEGVPLSVELLRTTGCWSEAQGVALLNDVLGILEFVHCQGIIHGDLKPKNLLRRTRDGKIVLIDFGAAQPISAPPTPLPLLPSPDTLSTTPLGYLSREHLSEPSPSSDLYALGMIVIEALTGLSPAQLPLDPETGEVRWQHGSVSEAMVFILNRLVCRNPKDRYQSAADVREVLRMLKLGDEVGMRKNVSQSLMTHSHSPSGKVVGHDSSSFSSQAEPVPLRLYARELAIASLPKLPPLLIGIGAGMATCNAIAISLGLHYLWHSAPTNPALDLLERATAKYEEGNLEEAIAFAEAIPPESAVYPESLTAMREWQREWHTAAAQVKATEQAFEEGRLRDVLEEARKIPDLAVWQQQVQPFVKQALPQLEVEAQSLLQQAYQEAAQKNFTNALTLLKQIPRQTPTGAEVQPKVAEYRRKQQIQAEAILQKAYGQAAEKEFVIALQYLSQIPEGTPTYFKARVKQAEYSRKQDLQEDVQRQAMLTARFSVEAIQLKAALQSSPSAIASEDLNPGNQLQEITPTNR